MPIVVLHNYCFYYDYSYIPCGVGRSGSTALRKRYRMIQEQHSRKTHKI